MSDDEDLTEADLSHLSVKDMNAAQRAELRRRFEAFVRQFASSPTVAPKPKPVVRKWVPGMKK